MTGNLSSVRINADKPRRSFVQRLIALNSRIDSCWIGDELAGVLFVIAMMGMIVVMGAFS